MVSLRKAELSDVTSINEIEQVAHISPWSKGLLEHSFTQRHQNYVAEIGGNIVGYLFTSHIANELTLENICVAKQLQGEGVGRALMAKLLQVAVEVKAFDIWLEVRESNVPAIGLYKKFGFTEQGIRKNYYSVPNSSAKENAILMKKAC